MIGIDTNILLRLFETDEHPVQTTAARRAVQEHAPVFLSAIVLVEFVWTLRRVFNLGRANIYSRLATIIDAPEFAVAFPQETRRAAELFETGPADFSDYLAGLIADRRRKPGDPNKDLLTRLIAGEHEGRKLSEEELTQNCIFILNAGHETTTNLIGNALEIQIGRAHV